MESSPISVFLWSVKPDIFGETTASVLVQTANYLVGTREAILLFLGWGYNGLSCVLTNLKGKLFLQKRLPGQTEVQLINFITDHEIFFCKLRMYCMKLPLCRIWCRRGLVKRFDSYKVDEDLRSSVHSEFTQSQRNAIKLCSSAELSIIESGDFEPYLAVIEAIAVSFYLYIWGNASLFSYISSILSRLRSTRNSAQMLQNKRRSNKGYCLKCYKSEFLNIYFNTKSLLVYLWGTNLSAPYTTVFLVAFTIIWCHLLASVLDSCFYTVLM